MGREECGGGREQCAEYHGSVADFDIETGNPYLVEMNNSLTLPNFFSSRTTKSKAKSVSNTPIPVQATLPVGNEKASSPTGGTEVENRSERQSIGDAKF